MQAPVVFIGDSDVEQRFCQQCGRFEPVSLFDGDKRSCRKGLERRRATDKRRQAVAAAAGTAQHFCMPGAHHGCFCPGCNSAAAANFQMAAAFQQQQAHAALWGCSSIPIAAAAVEETFAPEPAAAKRQKLNHSSSNISGAGNTTEQLVYEMPWAAQQQQQQQQHVAATADGDFTAMLQAFQTDHIMDWVTTELEADCALEQQLQQLQQQSAASALTASTGVTNTRNNNMTPVSCQPPHVAAVRPVWRMDSDTGSSGSSARTGVALANTPAAAAADADTVLDGLLDVLCNELQARAAAPTAGAGVGLATSGGSGSFASTAAVLSGFTASQQNNNSPALSAAAAAGVMPAATAAAGCADIRSALASIKAELAQVTASLVGHSAAAAAAPAQSSVSGVARLQQMHAAAAVNTAGSGAGSAVAQRLATLQQQMAQLSGHLAHLKGVQFVAAPAAGWIAA
jgi:hypothetical protein